MNVLLQLRLVALLEGVSLLVLVFVAMPLKYLLAQPSLARITGSVHGILFLLFLSALYRVALERHWPWRRSLGAVLLCVIPFGTFFLDRTLKRELEQESVQAH